MFDIVGVFPEADKDPVIQIANMVIRQGEKDPFIRNVFTLKSCAPIVGAEVYSYESETELLKVRSQGFFYCFVAQLSFYILECKEQFVSNICTPS